MAEHQVQVSLHIACPPEAVFAAFADPAQVCRYWFPRVSGPLAPDAEVQWFVGTAPDALAIDVRVTAFVPGERLAIEWGVGDHRAPVEWRFAADDAGTVVTVTEGGHRADNGDGLARLLDSTGGFNQVLVAAKAWCEHGVAVNIVEAKR